MRLIDADELIKCIPSEEYNSRFAVMNAPTFNPQNWIPCNERLPDETGLYIVTDKKERVTFRWYSIKFNFAELTDTEEVTAWMPLPDPYKEEE